MPRFQFSLRALLVATALVCCALVALPYWFRVLHERELKALREEISDSDERLREMGKDVQQHEPTLQESVDYLLEASKNGDMKRRLDKLNHNK